MAALQADLRFRGLVHQVTDERALELLDGPPIDVYIGFDPTAPSLHIGSLLQLCTLRRFQLAGHHPIALAGGGTGAIGDPGGKSEERPLLSAEQLDVHVGALRAQLAAFFAHPDEAASGAGAGGGRAEVVVVDNREWWSTMGVLPFLRDVGKHFTVNQMMTKESVRSRLERPEHGISYTEFSYMLLQAHDFVELYDRLGCTFQMGGSDQWGNITTGVDLVRRVRRAEAFGLTTPLVTKADGTKFGKTEEGTLWLDPALTSPYRLYQFLLRTADADAGRYLRYFTFLSHEEIESLERAVDERPEGRQAQRVLASDVTALVHGERAAERAERASHALFQGTVADLDAATLADAVAETPSSDIPGSMLASGRLSLVDALVGSALASSRGEARRLVGQGGMYLNDRRQEDPERTVGTEDLLHGRYLVLRKGRRQYHVMVVSDRRGPSPTGTVSPTPADASRPTPAATDNSSTSRLEAR